MNRRNGGNRRRGGGQKQRAADARRRRPGRTASSRPDQKVDREAEARADSGGPQNVGAEWIRSVQIVAPDPKQPISFRVDPDVLDFFKAQGPRYQTRMNAVLRAYMTAHAGEE